MTRRDFLRVTTSIALLATGGWILKRVFLPHRLRPVEVEAFAALLDTLIPDGELPGAGRSAIVEPLLAECQARRQTRRALVEGVRLLEREAVRRGASRFAALDQQGREEIVAILAQADAGSLPHFLYRTVRDRAMQLHYSRPAVWRALGLPHPPQPRGYVNFWQAPHV